MRAIIGALLVSISFYFLSWGAAMIASAKGTDEHVRMIIDGLRKLADTIEKARA